MERMLMEIPWPLNTTFRIHSQQDGEETWTVKLESDPRNGIIGEKTPLGESLLLSGENRKGAFIAPDKARFEFKIIGIKTPQHDENIFIAPVEYYLYEFRLDPGGIRHNSYMANICIKCGHQNTAALPGHKVCEKCKKKWYRDKCWKCQNPIDSRDPGTRKCPRCRYWICASCNSCFCQVTFPFHRLGT